MQRLIFLLLLLWIMPTMAQVEEETNTTFQPFAVQNTRLILADGQNPTLAFYAEPTICEGDIVDVQVDGMFIDVDAYAPRDAQECDYEVPYELSISLGDLQTNQSYVLLLNDFATRFYLPSDDEDPSSAPFTLVQNTENPLIRFRAVYSTTNDIMMEDSNGTVRLTLAGNHPDGCESDVFTWLRQDEVQPRLYHVDILRLLPEFVTCPAMLQPFSETVESELASDGDSIITIGDTYYSVAISREDLVDSIIYLPIENVTIVDNGNDYSVTVTARENQDCGIEPRSFITERDYISLVDLVLYVSFDMDCANDSRLYEETFTVSVLPVIINDTAYDESGELAPIAQSQSNVGADIMQVETVIEGVEIAVLESFPMQLQLEVTGYQPDGCDLPVQVEQTVDGSSVSIRVYRNVPTDVLCPMALQPYEDSIRVDGSFEGGTVEIEINNFTTSVDL